MTDDRTKHPAYVLRYAAAVSLIFTGAIMTLHAASRATVERNAKLFRRKAMVEMFDLGDVDALSAKQIADLYDKHISQLPNVTDPETGHTFNVYSATDSNDLLIGFAFSFTGTGFWARINGLLAVTPDISQVVGIAFLAHQETPGLGGRITERDWRRKFAGLDIYPPQEGDQYVYIGGEIAPDDSSPRFSRRVDAITGATGTCNAVESFLNQQIPAFRRAAIADGLVPPAAGILRQVQRLMTKGGRYFREEGD